MASLASHAKRAAFQLGTTELYMESEQRKVTRSLDASGKAQDAIRENKDAGFRLPPE